MISQSALITRLRYTVDESGCWLWAGYIKPNGYGAMTVRSLQSKGPMSAHVVSWIAHNGPMPAGMVVDHECHNQDPDCEDAWTCKHRRCVNPKHLRTTDQKTNVNAGRKPGPEPGTPRPERRPR